jgi:protein gp37
MGANSKIQWTDHTFNPWIGCAKVSAGCANCYAERDFDKRRGFAKWGPEGTRVITSAANWKQPLKWNREARDGGIRRKVFCASLGDIFEDWQGPLVNHHGRTIWMSPEEPDRLIEERGPEDRLLPIERENLAKGLFRPATMNDARNRLFRLIDRTPNLDWLLLTKRLANVWQMCPADWVGGYCAVCDGKGITGASAAAGDACYECGGMSSPQWPPNVWIGTSIENQATATERIPELLKIPAAIRFVSYEPALGPVDWQKWYPHPNHGKVRPMEQIDWFIAGGESGPQARPSHPDWFRSLRDQCQGAGVPFFFKQWGEWVPFANNRDVPPAPDRTPVCLVKSDGRVIRPYCGEDAPGHQMARIGKKAAGRLLDGREWSEFPKQD